MAQMIEFIEMLSNLDPKYGNMVPVYLDYMDKVRPWSFPV